MSLAESLQTEGRWDLMGGAEGEETGEADIIDLGCRLHGKVAFDTDSPEWANAPLKKVG